MALEPGDHVWYWNGNTSQNMNIPQADWFPGFQGPTDYLGHGEEIYNFVVYDDQIVRGQPHMRNHPGTYSWLDNNPGNITGSAGGPDYGQYAGKFNWHSFLIFPSWDIGFSAIAQLLRGPAYANRSILEAFQRYAPASDGNDPVAYANDVASALGLPTSTAISQLDGSQLVAMQNKITEIEGAVAGDPFDLDSPDLPVEITALLQ